MNLFRLTPAWRGLVSLLLALTLLCLELPGYSPAQAASNLTWQISKIDSTGNVGLYPSLDLHPTNQAPYISYYDLTKGDLKLAFPVAGGGDCGPSNTWSCSSQSFQNSMDYGAKSSLRFNSQGQWGIAYDNYTKGTNDYRGIPAPGGQELWWEPIELYNGQGFTYGNSLVFDQAGSAHVSYGYLNLNNGDEFIKYASYVGYGGNCGEGRWKCSLVAEVSASGMFMYNALGMAGNWPYIFYRNSAGNLTVAINGIGNCGSANDWNCSVIESSSIVEGYLEAYYQASPQYLGVAYIGSSSLRLAYWVGSDKGNCGTGYDLNDYQCITIDSVGTADNSQIMGASLSFANGQPVIAYTDANDRGTTVLKLAYPKAGGNCGPLGKDLKHSWQCEVVDNGGGKNDVGYYPSIRGDADGTLHVAYYDYTAGDLKYARSSIPLPVPPQSKVFLPFVSR